MNGFDLFLIVLVVVGGFIVWHLMAERDRRAEEHDEQLREWLSGRRFG